MRLLRNKEIVYMLLFMVFISIIGMTVSYIISRQAATVTALVSAVFIISFIFYTHWRYRQLDSLADYLMKINSGDYSLDIRDNAEGELSILKSEIYKVTVMLKEQTEALKQEKSSLANALSDISHQLKTPLTSMFVMTDLLRSKDLPDDKRVEFTKKFQSQLDRLQWLVTALLKLSKLEAGTVEFKKTHADPKFILDKACEPLLIPMELKEHNLRISGDAMEFQCDINWTVEAFVNILKNCVEHTPVGGVIKISYSQNPLYTQFVIQDNGQGIHAQDLPYIFDRFYKGKNAGDDSIGIGLAMAKTIITSQGGSIKVKSEIGNGTTFTIKFYN